MRSTTEDGTGFDELLREAVREPAVLLPNTPLLGGRFVVQQLLGSGGMGVVYKATDTERNASVALKMLTSVDAAGIYRLKQEFRALADVAHPNLVAFHELFCDQDRWFFTMELLPGDTLLDHSGKLVDEKHLRSFFAQLATGIQTIHEAGKLHRDLKPTNVMLTPEGRVVILDFGLASDQKTGGIGQTIVGDSISGTPHYMAPEQAAAEPACTASDWYAFGVMLFEALTGRLPFEGTGHAVLMSKQQLEAPQPSSLREGIAEDLDLLCLQLLRRVPEARPGWRQILEVLGSARKPLDFLVPPDETPFVGRTEELEALQEAFQATHKGLPVVVFIHGLSGVGKTTLVERFLRTRQQPKAVILAGRCYERESVPYKACDSVIDALSRHMRQLPVEQAANLLPRQIHAVAELFPALQRLDFLKRLRQRRPLPPDPSELRRAAFSALKELFKNVADQDPLVLSIDDLQWSDIDGAKLLSSLLAPPDPPPLLLIGAYRSEEVEAASGLGVLRERIGELEQVQVREIELGALSEQESHELVRDLLPYEIQDRAPHIAREARGSPFFITELARFASMTQDQAEHVDLEDAIKGRLVTLTQTEREVLEAICVSARPVEENLLRLVTDKGDVVPALRRLQAERLVRHIASRRSGKVATYHDRIRESLVSAMDEGYLRSWHDRLARSIEASESPDLVALTDHLLGAGRLFEAGACASKAADQASAALAFENAARLYRIALEMNPGHRENQRKLHGKLGTALANASRGAQAAQAFMRAAEGATLEEELEYRHLAAHQWLITGHFNEGKQELGSVLKTVGLKLHSRPSATLIDLLANRARIRLHGLDFRERQASEVPRKRLLELRACATAFQGFYLADSFQAAAFSARLLWLALKSGVVESVVLGFGSDAIFRSYEGVRNRFLVSEYLNRAQLIGQRIEDPEVLGFLQFAMGASAFLLGDFPKAAEHLSRAEQIYIEKCTGVAFYLSTIQHLLGVYYSWLGQWGTLCRKWDVWINDAEERGDLFLLASLRLQWQGTYRWLAVDQVEKARSQLSQGLAQWSWRGFEIINSGAAICESAIELYVGDHQKAFAICEDVCRRFFRSPFRRIELLRVIRRFSFANVALGFASVSPDRKALLAVAQQQADGLAKENCPLAYPYVPYIRGCICYLKGEEDGAIELLRGAAGAFEQAQLKLYAAATNRQLGRLLGGDEGRALVAQADESMRAEGVVRPERVAAMLAPGFPD